MHGMFFRRYKLAFSRVMMAVMVFASLAPAVSHALVNLTGNQSFNPKICTSNGSLIEKPIVVIQVKTTMGKRLLTELSVATNPVPQAAENHFEHCPFCANPQSANFLPKTTDLIIQTLEVEAQTIAERNVVAVAFQPYHTPPSQAPPQL